MLPRCLLSLALLCLVAAGAIAQPSDDTVRGDRMLEAYFRRQARQIAAETPLNVKSLDEWKRKRPEIHRRYMEMLGLSPLPPKTDLKATVTGKVEADHFTIEKLHFQSSPGLYVTGNLYVPKDLKAPAPAVLYVCGHANSKIDDVSYGSKVPYQYHPAWFARNGYVCLVVDTLQLGEIEGIHHGTYRYGYWWWQALGYTPAGIECWNAIRAIDYLVSRKDVDPKRLGVTGRSGGGATSWWLGAADERVQCIVPVAGLADLEAHVSEGVAERVRRGVITGHCDCMYYVNTYRYDFDVVMALCAPRALLLGNTDKDDIFPVPGYKRPSERVKKLYELYGVADKFQLLEGTGGHQDTDELRKGAFAWMNRWLKNDTAAVELIEKPTFTPQQLKVFDKPPADALNKTIHETFLKPAVLELPEAPEVARSWWEGKSKELRQALTDRVFRGWPTKPPSLDAKLADDVKAKGVRLRAYDFVSEEDVPLRVWLLTAEKTEKPKLVVLSALDEDGWKEWARDLGPDFQKALQLAAPPTFDDKKFEQNKKAMEHNGWAFAAVAPRGIGPTRWADKDDQKRDNLIHIRRRHALLGQTLDGQRVWDVRRALAALRGADGLKGVPLWLQGKRDMAGVALYAALYEPDVARLDLWGPPATHRQGPTFLNVLRVLDVPQAVALAYPRPVKLYVKGEADGKHWDWPVRLQKALGKEYLQIRVTGEMTGE